MFNNFIFTHSLCSVLKHLFKPVKVNWINLCSTEMKRCLKAKETTAPPTN